MYDDSDEPVLDLGNYYLGSGGAKAVAACMERNEAVQFLDLSHTKVGRSGGSAVLVSSQAIYQRL